MQKFFEIHADEGSSKSLQVICFMKKCIDTNDKNYKLGIVRD